MHDVHKHNSSLSLRSLKGVSLHTRSLKDDVREEQKVVEDVSTREQNLNRKIGYIDHFEKICLQT